MQSTCPHSSIICSRNGRSTPRLQVLHTSNINVKIIVNVKLSMVIVNWPSWVVNDKAVQSWSSHSHLMNPISWMRWAHPLHSMLTCDVESNSRMLHNNGHHAQELLWNNQQQPFYYPMIHRFSLSTGIRHSSTDRDERAINNQSMEDI